MAEWNKRTLKHQGSPQIECSINYKLLIEKMPEGTKISSGQSLLAFCQHMDAFDQSIARSLSRTAVVHIVGAGSNHHMSLMRILLHHDCLPLEGVLSVEC